MQFFVGDVILENIMNGILSFFASKFLLVLFSVLVGIVLVIFGQKQQKTQPRHGLSSPESESA